MKTTLPALLFVLAGPYTEAADTLASRVAAAQRSGAATWLAWSVPSVVDGVACCWNSRTSRHSPACSLEKDDTGLNISDDNGRPSDTSLMVYAHIEGSTVDKVRMFSNSCQVDRGAAKVSDIAGVVPSESVAYLESLVKAGDSDSTSKRRSDGAVMAIALHDDKSADPALERLARDGQTRELRHNAAFWLGNTRDRPGYEALVRLRTSADADFREQLTFAFSQSKAPQAAATLIDMARRDASPKVRGQALFWIAQKAQKKSDADVIRAATEDRDEEVKKKAVFALSQIPNGEGVPDLIRVAKENKNHEVRKQAMFWLGQSKDPRALAFFEKILSQ